MATEVARAGAVQRLFAFFRDVRAELDKVTWPERAQVKQLSFFVILFSLAIGFVIAIIDLILQGILQGLIPAILGSR
jgi:preprotein translocase SecE subunit